MPIRTLRFTLAFVLSAFAARAASPHTDHDHDSAAQSGALVSAKNAPAAWLAKAKAEYPTTQCVVSDDKLGGEMGLPADYIYKAEGKPDRLVRFCCKDCVDDFNKDPKKYLGEIDKAAAKKTKDSKNAAPAH